jgi:hypothetical protein
MRQSNLLYKAGLNAEKEKARLTARLEKRLGRALRDAIREIKARTGQGVDADGQPFAPYTEAYARFKSQGDAAAAKRREKKGLPPKPGRAAVVNLRYSGKMMQNITNTITRIATGWLGRITFSSTAESNKASGNMKKRRFFALSDSQVTKIRAFLQGEYD